MLRTVVRRSDIDMDKVVMLHVDSNFAGRLILEGFNESMVKLTIKQIDYGYDKSKIPTICKSRA